MLPCTVLYLFNHSFSFLIPLLFYPVPLQDFFLMPMLLKLTDQLLIEGTLDMLVGQVRVLLFSTDQSNPRS